MRILRLSVLAAAFAMTPAIAALPTPAAGLWQVESDIVVNGRNLTQDIRQIQQQILKNLPQEQRAQVAKQFGGPGAAQSICLTPEHTRRMVDPQRAVAMLDKEIKRSGCEILSLSTSGNIITLKGTCKPTKDGSGFQGDVDGRITYQDAHRITGVYAGQGTFSTGGSLGALLQAGGQSASGASGAMQSEVRTDMTWQGKDCGDVPPAALP